MYIMYLHASNGVRAECVYFSFHFPRGTIEKNVSVKYIQQYCTRAEYRRHVLVPLCARKWKYYCTCAFT